MGVTWVTAGLYVATDAATMPTRQESLAALSRRQFGLVSRAQLLSAGFSSSAIARASHRGELVPFQYRVWRVPSVPRCWEQRPMGTVLSIGGRTVASHITSAYLQELLPRASAAIEVTTDRSPGKRPGIIVYRNSLAENDIVSVRGIPCASVYRTLMDLCVTQHELDSEAALDAALRMDRVNFDRLCDYADDAASRRIKGSSALRRLLSVRGNEDGLSESEAESLFTRIMRRASLPIGQRQTPREGTRNGRIDFFYPDQKLVIEIDGRKFHAGRREKVRDKRYDNELNIGGSRVLRLTWVDLTQDESYVQDLVARALGIRPLF